MATRIILSIVVAFAVAILVYLLGWLCVDTTPLDGFGEALKNVSWAPGILAGVWYFFKGKPVTV